MNENNTVYTAAELAKRVAERGGRAYYVGGFVRDALRGKPNKDIDIEIHGLTPAQLEDILDTMGERISMGESFGIYGLKGCEIDIAMPRREKLRGKGHKDFDVFVDPFIGTENAAKRRDFTVNAMMQDVLTGEIIDHFGGREDIKNGVLRHVCAETFVEDPLRVLRGAQFAARFGYKIAEDTVELCRSMELDALARERVETEMKKALLKADKPSVFFEALREMDQLGVWFKEAEQMIGVEQNPRFHAEGDVWNHSMMVLDAAAKYRDSTKNPYAFMLAALTHDFGKIITTEKINGVIHAYQHETAGLPMIDKFLRRITNENKVIEYTLALAEYHMKPNIMAETGAQIKSTNRMFDSVPDPEALICLALCDKEGQIIQGEKKDSEKFLKERLEIYREYMARPYVMGKDLIEAGLKPGAGFAELLSYAHKLRLAGVDKNSALKQTLSYAAKKAKTE